MKKKISKTSKSNEHAWVFNSEDFYHGDEIELSDFVLKNNQFTGVVKNVSKMKAHSRFEYELDYYDRHGLRTGGDKRVLFLDLQPEEESKFKIVLDVPKNSITAELSNFYSLGGKTVKYYISWKEKVRDVLAIAIIIAIASVAFYYYIKNY